MLRILFENQGADQSRTCSLQILVGTDGGKGGINGLVQSPVNPAFFDDGDLLFSDKGLPFFGRSKGSFVCDDKAGLAFKKDTVIYV